MEQTSLNREAKRVLHGLLLNLEEKLDADVLALIGPILDGVEYKVRRVVEPLTPRRRKLAVVLHTEGGTVEVVERMVNILRNFYDEVLFVVPKFAMSAGTIFAMSGDAILMDYASYLGPIDPQVVREGKLIPALSYLAQYERLIAKSQNGVLSDAEFALLQRLDLGELHQIEMAQELSKSLLVGWLAVYKFKDWTATQSAKRPVARQEREQRAREIADALMDHTRWGSHGRGISMKTLRETLKLQIDDFGADPTLSSIVQRYASLVLDFMDKNDISQLVHSREVF
ncbi:SDH family Clp fold serine proteinase [Pendulispora albinea]|uniref:Serine dehydrogenasease n=1 Tax=Pendulispora albinea TaxID=2741071 RepID=A0ABZ2M8R3_9BACT